jgi:microcin C transport system ATP-binding protein
MSDNTLEKKIILRIEDLSVSFNQGEKQADIVKNISFNVEHNTTVALVGESGSGKSLTAHSIMRLLPYPVAFHPSGEICFNEENLLSRPLKSMTQIRGHDIGMIFQEPMSALNPLQTIEKQIGEAVNMKESLSKSSTRDAVLALLEKVHIVDPDSKLNNYPHQLSGGQRQRVMIAMALANRPKLLIADEPTTALDVTVQKEILDLLKELQEQFHMSILLITHDLGVVKYLADEVLVMQKGEIVERGETHSILNNPQNAYTQLLMNSYPKGKAVDLGSSIDKCPVIVSTDKLNVRFDIERPLFGKCKHFFHALKDLSFELHEGSTLGVLGESGSGKSTLALAILRLIRSSGEIQLNGQIISGLSEKKLRPLRSAMQVVFQDPFSSLSPRLSAKQIISEGLHLQGNLSKETIDNKVDDIMVEVGLGPETKHRYPHEFSGGQRQRIAIARAFILNPKLVFLDEPTSALDRAVQMQIITLLRKLQKERKLSYVFISHDIHVIKAISHNIMVVKNGEVVEYGPADKVLEKPSHPYTQKLLKATLD